VAFEETKLVLAVEGLREACELANDGVHHLDGLTVDGLPGSKPEDERLVEDARMLARAAIADLGDARIALSVLHELRLGQSEADSRSSQNDGGGD
jgi:hypothetical protein